MISSLLTHTELSQSNARIDIPTMPLHRIPVLLLQFFINQLRSVSPVLAPDLKDSQVSGVADTPPTIHLGCNQMLSLSGQIHTLIQAFPCFSTHAQEKIGKAWSIWWCNRTRFEARLRISTHSPTQLVCPALSMWPTAWMSGRRYATVPQTLSNYITSLTRPSWFFLRTLKQHGKA